MYNVFKDEILSKEWCNLLFEGRNKEYGAYELRRSAARRNALGVLGAVLAAALFALYSLLDFTASLVMEKMFDGEMPVARLKPLEAEEGHEVKAIAAGRHEPRPAAPEGTTMDIPDIVESEPVHTLDFGTDGPPVLEEEDRVFVQMPNDSAAHNTDRDDLPEEGPALTPVEVVEQMPHFPGGVEALMRFLDERIAYTAEMADDIGGDMELTFLVDKEGAVREPEVSKRLHPDLDRAALNALRDMPHWKPGKVGGQVALVRVKIPVHFQKQ